MKLWHWAVLGAAVLFGAAAGRAQPPEPVWQSNVYRAVKLQMYSNAYDLAREKYQTAWDFNDGTKNHFLYFSPAIKAPTVADGVLRFATASNKVTLGWGNYENRMPLPERVFLWPQWNQVELKVRQSAESSQWSVQLWQDGKRVVPFAPRAKSEEKKDLKGTAWQTLTFFVNQPQADGLEIGITGPANNQIEIDSLRVLQLKRVGYFRRTFDLPKGQIWRALAEVGGRSRLFVNGREISFRRYAAGGFVTIPVDVSPYLKTGRNCIALCQVDETISYLGDIMDPYRLNESYLQGQVVMRDGTVIPLDTRPGAWKAAPQGPDGWVKTDFDDRAWAPAIACHHPSGDSEMWRRIPAYDGRLVLENPGADPKLYFDNAGPLQVKVRMPEGLAQEPAVLQWVLRGTPEEISSNAVEPEVKRGAVESFRKDGQTGSIVYEVDAGAQARGVYTLEVSLWKGDSLIEKRIREPLVVTGKIPMPEVIGTNYTEGMNLVLEDTIDFTDPKDPHPWIESERQQGKELTGVDTPRIIRKGGLTYRETAEGIAAGVTCHFTCQFAFKKPPAFYLMELDYPDDADRCIGVSVGAIEIWGDRKPEITRGNKTGPAVITGYKFPNSGTMRTLRWLHFADQTDQVVNIASLAKDKRAAAARLRIYRVAGNLPAIAIDRSGERWFGLHTERASGVPRMYGAEDIGEYQLLLYNKLHLDMIQGACQRLKWMLGGCENYAQYLRFCGQNLHVMGAFQYTEANTSYLPPEPDLVSRVPAWDVRDLALRVFAANGITSISIIEYCAHLALSARISSSDGQLRLGGDTVFPVSKDGQQAGGAGCVSQGNFDHPAVQEAYLNLIDDLAQKFAFSKDWKGIYIMAFPTFSGPVTYAPKDTPFDYDYSDATIAAFEKETGIKLPVDPKDPKRFEKRYVFLTAAGMKAKWIDWRVQTVRRLVLKTRDLLRKYRPDLQVYYGYYFSREHIQAWSKSGRSYTDFLRDYGWDPGIFSRDDGIWTGRYFYPNAAGNLAGAYGNGLTWLNEVGGEARKAFEREQNRLVVMNTCWHEVDLFAPGSSHVWDGKESHISLATNWPAPHQHVRYVSQPGDEFALEAFTQAMIGSDPEIVMYGFTDYMFPMGYEQQIREFTRALLPLPKEKFQPVLDTADFEHNLALRALRKGREYWFYAANPGYWPIQGRVVLRGQAQVKDPATGATVAVREEAGKTVVPINLKAYGLAAFKVLDANAAIESWTNAPVPDDQLRQMQTMLADAEKTIGMPEVAQMIPQAERAYVRETLAQAKTALSQGAYARCWRLVTDGKFWTSVNDDLAKAARYAARIPGYEPRDRDPEQRPTLNVARAESAPKIDGKLDDAAWQKAPMTEGFISLNPQGGYMGRPFVTTAAQAAYDGHQLYLGFTMADANVNALKAAAKDGPEMLNYYDDCIVFFLNPQGAKLFQMGVNPAGLKFNSDATGRSGMYRIQDNDFGPWEAAVARSETGWTVEVAVPYATLHASAPQPGDQWRANFLRRYREFLDVPEMYWAKISRSWYDLDLLGYLKFM